MAESTKKAWREFSQRLNAKYTPRELGEAVLSLAEKKPRQRRLQFMSEHRIAIALGVACFILAFGWGWHGSRLLDTERALTNQLEDTLERESVLRERLDDNAVMSIQWLQQAVINEDWRDAVNGIAGTMSETKRAQNDKDLPLLKDARMDAWGYILRTLYGEDVRVGQVIESIRNLEDV